MQQVVLASSNAGKAAEIAALLIDQHLTVLPQHHFHVTSVAETGLSFVENALIKARHAALHTNLPAIADDSGLEVAALRGEPGIHSARYAGETATDADNIKKLLAALIHVPAAERHANFYCAMVFLRHAFDPTPIICTGSWSGIIVAAPKGQGGFGYDPIFYVPSMQCTAAELTVAQKNVISHRGQALRGLTNALARLYEQ